LTCVSAALRVFIPLLVCASALTAQQPDVDQPETSPNSAVSASSSIAPSYTPLDLTQKYFYSLNETTGPAQWIGFAVHAAMDQARESPDAWGTGPDSFGMRVANVFGRSLLRGSIAFGVGAFDREDPRYFRLEKGTSWKRVRYALTRTVMARRADGAWMPAYSRLVADYATPFLAQTWRPENFSVGRGFRGGSVAVGMGFGSNLWREFWPDLKKKVWKGSQRFPASGRWWMPSWL
jgi:hypothetical protein